MRIYVGVTDNAWFDYLKSQQPEEINFWRPLARTEFKAIDSGELFLFKLHYPQNYIVGGETFVSYSRLPLTVAWEAFGTKTGTPNAAILQTAIHKYRESRGLKFEPNPTIGCIILNNPFFLEPSEWLPAPNDWSPNIVQGKTYDSTSTIGASLLESLQTYLNRGEHREDQTVDSARVREERGNYQVRTVEDGERYEAEYLTRARLGQGGFRTVVTEAYKRQCAITGNKVLPVLQAAHIKPFAEGGPHRVDNGLLLRVDLHILFDQGYITITPDYRVVVSERINTQFEAGNNYSLLHGSTLLVVPDDQREWPNREFIDWHNQNVFNP